MSTRENTQTFMEPAGSKAVARQTDDKPGDGSTARDPVPIKIKCIVCGMDADPGLRREFEGETYYFHTGLCMISFEIELERIIAERQKLLDDIRNQKSLPLHRLHN